MGAPPAAAFDTYPSTPVEDCQPVFIENNQPQVDQDCIGPTGDADAKTSSECQPVFIENNQPQVDQDCIAPTDSSAVAGPSEACPPVYIDDNGNPQVDLECVG